MGKEGNGNPVLLPGKPHGQRSLVGYSPWGCKEFNITERLLFLFFSFLMGKGESPPTVHSDFKDILIPQLTAS